MSEPNRGRFPIAEKPSRQERTAIPKRTGGLPSAKDQIALITASLDDDKAENVVVIDLEGKAGFADYMVIATGRSDRQVGAMADHLREKLKAKGVPQVPAEGMEHRDWVLLDSGDVVIHLFRPEIRTFYNLEKLWSDEPAHMRAAERIA